MHTKCFPQYYYCSKNTKILQSNTKKWVCVYFTTFPPALSLVSYSLMIHEDKNLVIFFLLLQACWGLIRRCKVVKNQSTSQARPTDLSRWAPVLSESPHVRRRRLGNGNFRIWRMKVFTVARRGKARQAVRTCCWTVAGWCTVKNPGLVSVKPPVMWDFGWRLASRCRNRMGSTRLWHYNSSDSEWIEYFGGRATTG